MNFFKTLAKYCTLASKKCIHFVSKALAPIQLAPIKKNNVAFLKVGCLLFAQFYLVMIILLPAFHPLARMISWMNSQVGKADTPVLSLISVILRSHKIWKQFWVALSKLYQNPLWDVLKSKMSPFFVLDLNTVIWSL